MCFFKKISVVFFCVVLFFFGNINGIAQEGFQLSKGKKVDRVSFTLINNLVVVPVELNGIQLSFLLDTGVDKTVLFGVSKDDEVEINDVEKIIIRGWGDQEPKEALLSKNNTFKLGNAIDANHTIYVVFDEMLDFSKYMGVPIHGIIGYEYFKDFEVTVKYGSKKIITRKPKNTSSKPCRKCDQFPLEFFKNKPYLSLKVNDTDASTMLVDSGSSDAVWLFNAENYITETPKNYFEDFLGYTISGAIYGKRSRIDSLGLGKFTFESITTAFPENLSFEGVDLKKERGGSIGGALLSRFTTIIDYKNAVITLKKNGSYKDPFNYDLSGLTLIYDGSYQVKDLQDVRNQGLNIAFSGKQKSSLNSNTIRVDPIFQLFSAPKVVVVSVRENSAAALAGIKVGDAIIKINGAFSYTYELYEINALLQQEAGKKVTIEYERDNQLEKVTFKLKSLL